MTRFHKDRLEIINLDVCSDDWGQHFDDVFVLFVSLVVLFLNESLKVLKISLIQRVYMRTHEGLLELLGKSRVDLIESLLNLADKRPYYSQSCIDIVLHDLL
jgi:hypothetical protein